MHQTNPPTLSPLSPHKPLNLSIKTRRISCITEHTISSSTPKLKLRSSEKHQKTFILQASTAEIAEFDQLIKEQKHNLHRKQLSKVYEGIFAYISKTERGFYLGLEIRLARLFFLCIVKKARNSLVKKVANFTKIFNFLSQAVSVFKNYYTFLTTYINKTIFRLDAGQVLQLSANEYPVLDDEKEEKEEGEQGLLPPFLELLTGKFGGFDEEYNKINEIYEAGIFVRKMLEMMILLGFYYKRVREGVLAYRYLKKAHKTALKLQNAVNPDILNLCSKAHLAYAVFLLEVKKFKKAKNMLYSIIVLLQAELFYRMSPKPKETKKSDRERKCLKRTIKTLLTVLLNLVYCLEQTRDIAQIAETFNLIEFFTVMFLAQNDEFRKSIVKLIKDFRKKFNSFILETTEFSSIIDSFLKKDDIFQSKYHPRYLSTPSYPSCKVSSIPSLLKTFRTPATNIIKPMNKEVEKVNPKARFSLDLRNTKPFETNIESMTKRTASTWKKPSDSRRDIAKSNDIYIKNNDFSYTDRKTLRKEASVNMYESQDSVFLMDFLNNNSFMRSDEESSMVSADENPKENMLLQSDFNGNMQNIGQKLIQGHFKPLKDDYKPKILTSDEYFVKVRKNEEIIEKSEKIEKNREKTKNHIENDGILLDNLQLYPRKPGMRCKSKSLKDMKKIRVVRDYFTETFEKTINDSLKDNSQRYKSPSK